MPKVRVSCFAVSLDGYGAGPSQSLNEPLGVGGESLHEWLFPTQTFRSMYGNANGERGVDDDFARRGMENVGGWIIGRNMFAPSRGPWPDDGWKGWWGANPPYHSDVFVLTHYAHDPIPMEGGTTFHFVTTGIRDALDRARESAGDKDVRIVGGAAVIRQYLREKLVDEMHVAVAPLLLGSGEPLFEGIDLKALGYDVAEHATTPNAMHVVFRKRSALV